MKYLLIFFVVILMLCNKKVIKPQDYFGEVFSDSVVAFLDTSGPLKEPVVIESAENKKQTKRQSR